ncbi:MAG: response regulator transcription factor [Emcibacter sp.]|nr:response regulator transcription factor [Emcibacter sp.]
MRVLLIDQFDICREGMKNIILNMNENCDFLEADTIEEGIRVSEGKKVDLIVIDLDVTQGDSLWVIDKIESSHFESNVVLLSTSCNIETARRAQEIGVSAFINKLSKKEIISSVFQIAMAGGRYFSPEIFNQVSEDRKKITRNIDMDSREYFPVLSKRQLEVLRLVAEGKPNKVIARDLNIATGTVKVHIASILKTLKAKNRTEAVNIANHINLL